MRFSTLIVATLATLGSVTADIYMHNMRGGNNRLDEANRDRANGNRLFDSENNNRGGSNVGNLYYYEGSELDITWTNQHACGDPRAMCEVIIQYMCDPLLRDGTVTQTIPIDNNQCYNNNCDTDVTFGRHESQQYYSDCRYRSRNFGLFTSTQNPNGLGAQFTRQNPNGDRHGYECPEERDYYPYWGPSPWRDVAILTNQPERCASYQAESQNVKSRFYCQAPEPLKKYWMQKKGGQMGVLPIDKLQCESLSATQLNEQNQTQTLYGIWMESKPFNIAPPVCRMNQWTRDNHLGNTYGGFPAGFNWTIPALSTMPDVDPNRCVLRIRYNITTGDFGADGINNGAGGFASKTSALVSPLATNKQNKVGGQNENNRQPSLVDVWTKYGLTNQKTTDGKSVYDSFQQSTNDPNDPKARLNTREYVNKNNPNVDLFGTLLPTEVRGYVKTQLAINTAQYGRTFQDRSHRFKVVPAPAGVDGKTIHNLNVQGKRGNIVQVYPGVEYDFTPNRLHVPVGEYIHAQWTGSNTNPNNNAGQGTAGSDRHNMMLLVPKKFSEGQVVTTPTTYGQWGTVYPNRIDKLRTGAPDEQTFLGLTDPLTLQHLAILDNPGGQFGGSMDELNDAGTYFDAGLIRATVQGIYHYLCTRNNNFSNRDQKGKIVVSTARVQTLTMDSQAFSSSPSSFYTPNSLHTASLYVAAEADRPLQHFMLAEYPKDSTTDVVAASNIVHVNGIAREQAELTLPYQGSSITTATVLYATSLDGPWTTTDATIDGNNAKIQTQQDGYYVVTTKLNAGAIAGIVVGCVVFATLLVAASIMLYRRRKAAGNVQHMTEHTSSV